MSRLLLLVLSIPTTQFIQCSFNIIHMSSLFSQLFTKLLELFLFGSYNVFLFLTLYQSNQMDQTRRVGWCEHGLITRARRDGDLPVLVA